MLNIAFWVYLVGSIITILVLGYIGYDEEFPSGRPPSSIATMFWPITLVIFLFLQLYALGHYLKKTKEARAAKQKLLREAVEVASPRPRWLGPPPK